MGCQFPKGIHQPIIFANFLLKTAWFDINYCQPLCKNIVIVLDEEKTEI